MSAINETPVFSKSNQESVEKTILPDKYVKQMVFGYWIHKHSMERKSTILESIQLHSDIEIQKMFYDEFNENYKVIKADMMMEIKNNNPDEEAKLVKTRSSSKSKKTSIVSLEKTADSIDDVIDEEEKIPKISKPVKAGKVGPKEKPEKSEKSEKSGKIGKSEKSEKIEKSGKIEKSAKGEKPDTSVKVPKSSKGKKSTKMVEKIIESEMVYNEITINHMNFLMDESNILYDTETKEMIGHYDSEKNQITTK